CAGVARVDRFDRPPLPYRALRCRVFRGVAMDEFWNPHARYMARVNRCKGSFSPKKYAVRIDDSHDQWRYELATRALWGWGTSVAEFCRLSAEYVLRHHRRLADVRHTIREEEKAMRRRKRERERRERAERRAATKGRKR